MSQISQMMRRMVGTGGMNAMGGMGGMAGMGISGGGGKSQMPKDPEKIAHLMTKMQNHMEPILNYHQINLLVDNASHRLPELVKIVDASGIELDSVQMHKPTLDDVFLSVTGRSIRDETGSMLQTIRQFRTLRQARGQRTPH